VLHPATTWASRAEYDTTLAKLAGLFTANFKTYLEDCTAHVGADMAARILAGGPQGEANGVARANAPAGPLV
jgi:hypothetical protein